MGYEFDMNVFKREMTQWVRDNPVRNDDDFEYFCVTRIPVGMDWLITESLAWYKNMRLQKPRHPNGKFKKS